MYVIICEFLFFKEKKQHFKDAFYWNSHFLWHNRRAVEEKTKQLRKLEKFGKLKNK